MIDNCKYILNLYKEHVLKIKAGEINIKDYIDEMITYVAKNVFPILDQYKNNKSAVKCNPYCDCELELDKVYENFRYQNVNQSDGHYRKYLKYKLKYLELKKNYKI